MKLILVRHGESEENTQKILAGHIPGNLTEAGIEQAQKTAKELKDLKITKFYSSPLNRALFTAKEIHKFHQDTELIITEDIIERDFGKESQENTNSKVESLKEVHLRIKNFISLLKSKYSTSDTIIVVSHSNPLRYFLVELEGIDFNEALNTKSFKNGEWRKFEI